MSDEENRIVSLFNSSPVGRYVHVSEKQSFCPFVKNYQFVIRFVAFSCLAQQLNSSIARPQGAMLRLITLDVGLRYRLTDYEFYLKISNRTGQFLISEFFSAGFIEDVFLGQKPFSL